MANTDKIPTPRRTKSEAPLAPRVQRAERRCAKAATVESEPPPSPAPLSANPGPARAGAPGGKLGVIVAMMRRPEGATVVQMSEATDWLPHSVRGALAGALKRKHQLTVTSEKTEAGRVYRIAPVERAEPTAEPTAEPAAEPVAA
jgi:hypothetical protein